jgi:hypothetical protein
MKKLIPFAIMLLVGCDSAKPERTAESTNKDVKVFQMTRFDDCVIYAVEGLAEHFYFVRCSKGNIQSLNTRTEEYECGRDSNNNPEYCYFKVRTNILAENNLQGER